MVAILAIIYFSFSAIRNINVDIFPEVELPAIYISMPYGGLTPQYMDGFMANEFQKVLLFVSGVKDIEFKSIQGLTLMKLSFYPGTDMAQSAGEVSTMVSRAMGFLPPGATPPMVVRFDGSSLPIGQLVFESPQRSLNELQNLVITRVRPLFVNVPGVTAPAPFGGNARTIVVKVNPMLMQSYGISAEEVTLAITKNSHPSPAGNVRIGDQNLMSPVNSIANGPEDFLNTPIRVGENQTIFVKDIASVEDAGDVTTGYAIVNGQRSIYLPVIKKSDASTLDVVENLKTAMPMLKDALPEDVKIRYVFDQSGHIKNSLSTLLFEGILGAILTGLMVFLFLKDSRGALIVVLTIPISLLSAVVALYTLGQTINMMTLSGLALAIGILVDEATVTIENIHQHFERKKGKAQAILDAVLEISIPKLLILLSILAVLIPSFLMTGIPKDMFVPLSIAVGFAMISSFIFSQTFVPILAHWMMKKKPHQRRIAGKRQSGFNRFKIQYTHFIGKIQKNTARVVIVYALIAGTLIILTGIFIGTDILPTANEKDIQLRIVAPEGTRLEKTEHYVHEVTEIIKKEMPKGALSLSSAYAGLQPSSSPINPIFSFTSASHEAILQLSIDKQRYKGHSAVLKDSIRKRIEERLPELQINFEPMELVSKIMSQGAMTPVEIKVASRQLQTAGQFADKIQKELAKVPFMRDVRIAEPLNYPSLQIEVDRELVAQFGLSMQDVTKVLNLASSSSRFTDKNMWIDPASGLVFQVQVQFPEAEVASVERLLSLPLKSGSSRPVLADVATIGKAEIPAQINRQGPNRYVTVLGNIHEKDLGSATKAVNQAIKNAGEVPAGTLVKVEGMLSLLSETMESLQNGLLIALVVIFLMMAMYYQSFAISGLLLSVVPAVVSGSMLFLLVFGSTLNLQSYMGIIMSIGVSVSNAVLLVNQAEYYRKELNFPARQAAKWAASTRLRPILMTTIAMIAGMVPLASGMGEGGDQVAPLGQAVIGGLIFSSVTTLLVLPNLFSWVQKKATRTDPSLDPEDPASKYFQSDYSN